MMIERQTADENGKSARIEVPLRHLYQVQYFFAVKALFKQLNCNQWDGYKDLQIILCVPDSSESQRKMFMLMCFKSAYKLAEEEYKR